MRRFALPLVVFLILVAAKPMPFDFGSGRFTSNSVVEQQSPGGALCTGDECVVNPTQCPWDPDERVESGGSGYLMVSESVTWHGCVIADWASHLVWASASARNADLETTITMANSHGTWSHSFRGSGCMISPEYDKPSVLLAEVPESNGGVGDFTTITVTLENVGAKTARKVLALIGIEYDQFASRVALRCGDDLTCVGSTTPGREPRVCWGSRGDLG